MKRLIAVFISATLLSGCYKEAESSESVGRGITLEKLFTQGNCTMYRFGDGGHAVYWSNCAGDTQYQYTTSDGKHVYYHEQRQSTSVDPVHRSDSERNYPR